MVYAIREFTCLSCADKFVGRYRAERKFCSPQCSGIDSAKYRHPMSLEDRFWSKANKTGPVPEHRPDLGPCWLWINAKNADGYGLFYLNGKYSYAHRVAWMLGVDDIPFDIKVLHHCDNPPCVNPGHLFLGTQRDNVMDMRAKGRTDPRFLPTIRPWGQIEHAVPKMMDLRYG